MIQFKIPKPELQITFFHRLKEIRETYLIDSLLSVVATLQISKIDAELGNFVSNSGLQKMAGWGLRGEIVFPVPCILHANPKVLGYYRLLLGFSQKQFYGSRYGFGPLKSMEEKGLLSASNESVLPDLCQTLCASAEFLVQDVDELSQASVHELTLLTLGPQLRGGALNILGTRATKRVFDLISSIVEPSVVSKTDRSMEIENAAGRPVKVEFASDPDICIREELPSGKFRNLVAIEIKGGRDYSNIHNRIGEAEKSHQKAKKQGYVECWTMVGVQDLDMALARRESPTTDRFFLIENISEKGSAEFEDFRENLLSRVAIRG
jgi:XcyI restriction endonuclease